MKRRTSSTESAGRLASLLAVVVCSACGLDSRPAPGRDLPEPNAAAQAVEQSLRSWQDSPDMERTTATIKPIMFVDQQEPPGRRLRAFEVLGESPGYKSYRRFLVKLFLEDPDESIVVPYHVFGRGPIWVYRAEDFDMIMHMDKSMMPAPPPLAEASVPERGPNDAPNDH